MSKPIKRNAIVHSCNNCRYFHNPEGLELGACIRLPPTPFIVGIGTPSAVIAKLGNRPENVAPVVRGYFPILFRNDGCGEFEPDLLELDMRKPDLEGHN
jgi:hypothetical protein